MSSLISKKIIRTLLAACFVLLLITAAKAQEIEYVGSNYLGGRIRGLHVNEPYAICGMKNGFQILDVSNPEAISKVGGNPFLGSVRGFAVSGTYAYATTFEYEFGIFFILDIQDVQNPEITGVLEPVGRGQLDVSGDYAYILDYDETIDIVDISDPFNPELAGEYVSSNTINDIFISGTYAYLAVEGGWLEIVDISNPVEPVSITRYYSPLSDHFREVFISGAYAYCAVLSSSGIEIVDISDPSSPAYVGRFDETGWGVGDIFVDGNYLYAIQEWIFDEALFIVVNVEDRENPYIEWSNDIGSIMTDFNIFVSDDRAYLTIGLYLAIMDVSTPSSPVPLGEYRSWYGLDRISTSGAYAFGLVFHFLYVFNIADNTSPEVVGIYDHGIGRSAVDIAVAENFAYVTIFTGGFDIVDISIPESPTLVGEYEASSARGIDIKGDYVYLSANSHNLQIVDISDPSDPTLTGECRVEWIEDVMVRDDLAFIARKPRQDDNYGFMIADISDPAAPIVIGSCETPDAASVSVEGQYAYMTVGSDGIVIIDINDPYNPLVASYYDTPGMPRHVYTQGNYAYITDSSGGLIIIDISDPPNPELVEAYDTRGIARSSYVSGQLVYVADDYSLIILRFIGGPCDYIPGDCDHNGTPMEMSDVLAMIGNYRGTVAPYHICDCGVDPPGAYFAATADPNGNCVANELNDVVTEIAAYRGLGDVSGCPDCPGSGR